MIDKDGRRYIGANFKSMSISSYDDMCRLPLEHIWCLANQILQKTKRLTLTSLCGLVTNFAVCDCIDTSLSAASSFRQSRLKVCVEADLRAISTRAWEDAQSWSISCGSTKNMGGLCHAQW